MQFADSDVTALAFWALTNEGSRRPAREASALTEGLATVFKVKRQSQG